MIRTTELSQKSEKKMYFFSGSNTFYRKLSFHNRLILMFTTPPGCHNQPQKSLTFFRRICVAALRVVLTKAFQTLKENPEDCNKNFSNVLNFHRFHVHLFKLCSSQFNHHADSDSPVTILFVRLGNQNNQLGFSIDQKIFDAEPIKKEGSNVLTQIEFHKSLSTDTCTKQTLSTPYGYFSNR